MLYFRRYRQAEAPEDRAYYQLARNLGIYLVLIFTLVQPVIAILDLIVLPANAMSDTVLACYFASLAIGMVLCLAMVMAIAFPGRIYEKNGGAAGRCGVAGVYPL